MEYGYLMENPRRRRSRRGKRKASARKRRRSRRRATTVTVRTNPAPKRRRRSRRSGRRRTSSRRRRNPAMLGGIAPALKRAGGLVLGDFLGDALTRVVGRFAPQVRTGNMAPFARMAVGVFAEPLLRMARVPQMIRADFAAVNVASGLFALTANMRQRTMQAVGLSDYELADYELAGAPPAGILSDYELAADEDDPIDLLGSSYSPADDEGDLY